MRRTLCAWLLAALLPALAPCESPRRLTGRVLFSNGKPAEGAVVKLEDQSKGVRTALATADGSFQFSRLLPDLDYQVRATYANMESHRVRWSRLSSRKEKNVTLILQPVRKLKASAKPGTVGQVRLSAATRRVEWGSL